MAAVLTRAADVLSRPLRTNLGSVEPMDLCAVVIDPDDGVKGDI